MGQPQKYDRVLLNQQPQQRTISLKTQYFERSKQDSPGDQHPRKKQMLCQAPTLGTSPLERLIGLVLLAVQSNTADVRQHKK
jgi:hypothetical protein